MTRTLEYYTQFGEMTDPRKRASFFADLPRDIDALCWVVQGLMVHIFWAEWYGLNLSEERKQEVQIRPVARKLALICELDASPLTTPRPLDKKLIGNCRDHTVLLVAMLKHQGVPARARCGFATYFDPKQYVDHWVVEYWNAIERRWIMVDAQLDALQRDVLKIDFNPLDVPRNRFIVGGEAWRMCRAGQANADAFGIFNMHGLWFVRGDFVRDVASLNQMELLPWDSWGLIDKRDNEMTADENAFLDHVAELTCDDVPQFDVVHSLYEQDARLRVPPIITTYLDSGTQKIDLAKEME